MRDKLTALFLTLLLLVTGCGIICGGTLASWCDGDCPSFHASDYDTGYHQIIGCGEVIWVLMEDLYGEELYFDAETLELLAVREFSDIEEFCGEFSAWYGPEIDCEPQCVHADEAEHHYWSGELLEPCG